MTYKLIDKERFDALSNAEKRVEIAKDIILRIQAEKIVESPGNLIGNLDSMEESDLSIQDFFNRKACYVCAKGALVCSWVGNFNHYSKKNVLEFDMDLRSGEGYYPTELLEIFGREMLDNIELAFEQSLFTWHIKFEDYYDDFESDFDSPYCENIQAIMENIVENNGEFIF